MARYMRQTVKKCIAIGGAFSIDKKQRIAKKWGWWEDEQPSDEIKQRVEERLDNDQWFCGHYHTNKSDGDIRFLFDRYATLDNKSIYS